MNVANKAEFDVLIDCRGLNCPHPIVNMAKEMRNREEGEIVKIIADDPACPSNLKAWIKRTKNELLTLNTEQDKVTAFIRKTFKNYK